MAFVRGVLVGWLVGSVVLASAAVAQQGGSDPYAPASAQTSPSAQTGASPADPAPPEEEAARVTVQPLPADEAKPATPASEAPHAATSPNVDPELLLDGHVRSGPFLAGPGSLAFVLHHSLMGATGGLVTMGITNQFRIGEAGTREAMLAGTLIGAGLGFGVSAWWQFNNWLDSPVAMAGIINSVIAGAAVTGLMDFFVNDSATLAWSALIGAELGAWLTVGIGGGEMPMRRTLAIASGAGWAAIYTGLLLATVGFSSGAWPTPGHFADGLMLAAGGGALGMAIAGLQFDPSAAQVVRADLFGLGVGGAVFLLSGLVMGGFNNATPYVLSLLASAGAITAVSVFWVEAAERPGSPLSSVSSRRDLYRTKLYRSKDKAKPYSNPWW